MMAYLAVSVQRSGVNSSKGKPDTLRIIRKFMCKRRPSFHLGACLLRNLQKYTFWRMAA